MTTAASRTISPVVAAAAVAVEKASVIEERLTHRIIRSDGGAGVGVGVGGGVGAGVGLGAAIPMAHSAKMEEPPPWLARTLVAW